MKMGYRYMALISKHTTCGTKELIFENQQITSSISFIPLILINFFENILNKCVTKFKYCRLDIGNKFKT